MKTGFTLLELLVTLLIIGVLCAVALPYYVNSVENARLTEVVLLWGRQKNFITGKHLTSDQAQRYTEHLQKAHLNYFTGQVFCNGVADTNPPCWEAEFTQREPGRAIQYKLQTVQNFLQLGCIGLNTAGTEFCQSQTEQKTPIVLPNGNKLYIIR